VPRSGPPPLPVSSRLTKRLVFPDHDARISSTFYSPDGRWVLASSLLTGGVQIWDAHTGEQIRTLRLPKGSGGYSSPPIPSPDGRTLYVPFANYKTTPIRKDGKVGSRYDVDGEITVWDVASGRQLPSLKQSPPHAILSVKVSPDGAILFSHDLVGADEGIGYKRVLTQWDLRTGKHHHLLDDSWIPVFAPDGKTFAASVSDISANRSKVVLRDVATGKERLVFAETQKGLLSGSVFSPDGRYLAGNQDLRATQEPPEVKLWEVATGKEIGSFAAPKGTTTFRRPGSIMWAFTAPAFSPDGRWLAACLHTGRVYLYDVAGRKLAWTQDVKNGWLRQLGFSPDGRWLAVAGQDSPEDLKPREEVSPFDLPQPRIFLFDMKAGGQSEEIVVPHGQIGLLAPAFSPDGKTIALGGTGCVWLFDVSRPETRK
jgi:WD40 repeat protein